MGDGSRTTHNFVKGTERFAFTNAAMGAAQPVQNFVYTHDAVGNVSGRGDLINNLSETFGYDALDRLTSSTVTNGTGPHPVAYQYGDDRLDVAHVRLRRRPAAQAGHQPELGGEGRRFEK